MLDAARAYEPGTPSTPSTPISILVYQNNAKIIRDSHPIRQAVQIYLKSPTHEVTLTESRTFWMAYGASLSDTRNPDTCAGDNLNMTTACSGYTIYHFRSMQY